MKKVIWTIAVFLLLCATAWAQSGQELAVSNVSRYLGNSQWSWTIFLTGPKELLDSVNYVEYKLHPTFPNPVQRVDRTSDRNYPFGFSAIGWGTFAVGVKVVLKDGQVRQLTHMLQFVSASSQDTCRPPVKLLNQHPTALVDDRFTDPPVFMYVSAISTGWAKSPPILTIYFGISAPLDLDKFVSPSAFKLATKGVPPGMTWSMIVQHEGDALQFRYGYLYYLLTVTKVNPGLGDKNYLDLQICERLPTGVK